MSDALNAGVRPGGLQSRGEIRILILYLLDRIAKSVSEETLAGVLQDNGYANYFEIKDAMKDLTENGNLDTLSVDGTEHVALTEQGRRAIDFVEEDLPKTVRENAVRTLLRVLTKERNARDNHVRITEEGDGFAVSFTMADHDTKLMELSVYTTTREEAETLKNNFTEDPARVYSAILASLMAD